MMTIRWIFSEIVRLVRACWIIYFEAHPFTFRDGDISRSFSEKTDMVTGIGSWLNHKIVTSDRLFVKSINLASDVAVGTLGSTLFLIRIYSNGEVLFEADGNSVIPLTCNLVFGPGEYTFFVYQNTGGGRLGYVTVEAWERNEDDNERRLRPLSPVKD